VSIFALFKTTVKVRCVVVPPRQISKELSKAALTFERSRRGKRLRRGVIGSGGLRECHDPVPVYICSCMHACMHAGAGSSPHSLLSCSRRTPWTLWVRLMIRLATGNQRNHHHHCMLGRDRTSQDRPGRQSRERGTCSYSPPYLVDRTWCIDGCRPVVV
jgi:hypothetical protein